LSGFYTWLADSGYSDPDRVFTVVDQIDGSPAIRVSGERWGGIITRQEFSDYHLVVEFRWGLLTWGSEKAGRRTAASSSIARGRRQHREGLQRTLDEVHRMPDHPGGVGDIILVDGYDPTGNHAGPSLTVTARRDRDGEDVYDPKVPAREFRRGRINWFGRDPDWDDVLGFRGKQDVESPDGQWTRVEVICQGDRITNIVNGTTVNVATRSTLQKGRSFSSPRELRSSSAR